MLAVSELISFHAAVFGVASVGFFYLLVSLGPGFFGGTGNIKMVWLLSGVAVVVAISRVLRAYKIRAWRHAKPHGASALIAIGHLAPITGVYLIYLMRKAGTGSGLIFIPISVWSFVFYTIGAIWAADRVSRSAYDTMDDE